MANTKYYVVVFRDAGSPASGLTPAIDTFKNLVTGVSLSVPAITEVGSGIYKFSINWDSVSYSGVNQIVMRADSGDTGMTDADRYVFGVINRTDDTDIYTLQSTMYDLQDVQILGDWTIENDQLFLYKEDGSLVATYDLFDINGSPTSTAPVKRIRAS